MNESLLDLGGARLARRNAEEPNTQPIELPDSTNATNDATNATSITDAGPLSLDLGGARLARRDAEQPNTQPIELPDSTNATNNATNATSITDAGPLFPDDELHTFRTRWDQVQASFVDEPRHAVEQADSLVANVVKRIAEQFSAEREKLENQWGKGDNVSTEDLRQALRRYRSFFDRLLSF
jgi:hypothetical protein